MDSETDTTLVLRALDFAARRHADQRRKGGEGAPYINHPIRVAYYLARLADVRDDTLIAAALLHDTVEDTETTIEELRREFGERVASLVAEVTDDKSLAKETRKQLQIEHAPEISQAAAQLKIADKLCNVEDIANAPPSGWSLERRSEYLSWTERVVDRLPSRNPRLETVYRETLARARADLDAERARSGGGG
jgi:guanosine-3',5'-bis(diphosphate) 3'-pyrophosphohydrolase